MRTRHLMHHRNPLVLLPNDQVRFCHVHQPWATFLIVTNNPDPKPIQHSQSNGSSTTGGSFFTRWFKRDGSTPGPVKASLGEETSFYYDKDLKKWVNKKVTSLVCCPDLVSFFCRLDPTKLLHQRRLRLRLLVLKLLHLALADLHRPRPRHPCVEQHPL